MVLVSEGSSLMMSCVQAGIASRQALDTFMQSIYTAALDFLDPAVADASSTPRAAPVSRQFHRHPKATAVAQQHLDAGPAAAAAAPSQANQRLQQGSSSPGHQDKAQRSLVHDLPGHPKPFAAQHHSGTCPSGQCQQPNPTQLSPGNPFCLPSTSISQARPLKGVPLEDSTSAHGLAHSLPACPQGPLPSGKGLSRPVSADPGLSLGRMDSSESLPDHHLDAESWPCAAPSLGSKVDLSQRQALESQHLLLRSTGCISTEGATDQRHQAAGIAPRTQPQKSWIDDLPDGSWTAQLSSVGHHLAVPSNSLPGSPVEVAAGKDPSDQPLSQTLASISAALPLVSCSLEQQLMHPQLCATMRPVQLPIGVQQHASLPFQPAPVSHMELSDAYSAELLNECDKMPDLAQSEQLPDQDAWQQSCNVSEQADPVLDELSALPEHANQPADPLEPATPVNGKLPASLVRQMGGLYTVYAVYAAQPCKPKVNIACAIQLGCLVMHSNALSSFVIAGVQ